MIKTLALAFWLSPLVAVTSMAATATYYGTVKQVIDGDTIVVHIPRWPIPFTPMTIRLDGIDTPESMRQFAKCEKELRLGLTAKAELKTHLPVGSKVKVVWVGRHEKNGRLLSIIYRGRENVNAWMVKRGYAVEYYGKTKISWCK